MNSWPTVDFLTDIPTQSDLNIRSLKNNRLLKKHRAKLNRTTSRTCAQGKKNLSNRYHLHQPIICSSNEVTTEVAHDIENFISHCPTESVICIKQSFEEGCLQYFSQEIMDEVVVEIIQFPLLYFAITYDYTEEDYLLPFTSFCYRILRRAIVSIENIYLNTVTSSVANSKLLETVFSAIPEEFLISLDSCMMHSAVNSISEKRIITRTHFCRNISILAPYHRYAKVNIIRLNAVKKALTFDCQHELANCSTIFSRKSIYVAYAYSFRTLSWPRFACIHSCREAPLTEKCQYHEYKYSAKQLHRSNLMLTFVLPVFQETGRLINETEKSAASKIKAHTLSQSLDTGKSPSSQNNENTSLALTHPKIDERIKKVFKSRNQLNSRNEFIKKTPLPTRKIAMRKIKTVKRHTNISNKANLGYNIFFNKPPHNPANNSNFERTSRSVETFPNYSGCQNDSLIYKRISGQHESTTPDLIESEFIVSNEIGSSITFSSLPHKNKTQNVIICSKSITTLSHNEETKKAEKSTSIETNLNSYRPSLSQSQEIGDKFHNSRNEKATDANTSNYLSPSLNESGDGCQEFGCSEIFVKINEEKFSQSNEMKCDECSDKTLHPFATLDLDATIRQRYPGPDSNLPNATFGKVHRRGKVVLVSISSDEDV